jgi:hypothetical protein
VTEGILITTKRPPAPLRGTHYNYNITVDLLNFPNSGTKTWKIIVGFEDTNNFDWVSLTYDWNTGLLIPTFWRRTGGSDAKVMDPDTYPANQGWSAIPGGTASHTIYICYAAMQWSVKDDPTGNAWEICGGGKATLPLNTAHGLIGFLGEDDTQFDNLYYKEHWESNLKCEYCTCTCIHPTNSDDYKCLPTTLQGVLIPTGDDPCTPLDNITIDFFQAEVNGNCDNPASTYDDRAEKKVWVSELIQIPTNGEQSDTYYHFRFRVECSGSSYTLSFECNDANLLTGSSLPVQNDWSVSFCDDLYLVFHGIVVGGDISCDLGGGETGVQPYACGGCYDTGSGYNIAYDLVLGEAP